MKKEVKKIKCDDCEELKPASIVFTCAGDFGPERICKDCF